MLCGHVRRVLGQGDWVCPPDSLLCDFDLYRTVYRTITCSLVPPSRERISEVPAVI